MTLSPASKKSYTNRTQRQVKEGIDAVIVDSVLAIRKGLTTGEEGAAATPNLAPDRKHESEIKLEEVKLDTST